jgi:SAM-dependent methyltransferase
MELLSPYLDVQGIDIDPRAVRASIAGGMEAVVARAEQLPFEDGSFDIVYCSYLLLWVEDPAAVVREMARVSREWVVCLAEPDHLARVSYPPELAVLDRLLVNALRDQGADPGMGRKLPQLFARCGLRPIAGVHANMWGAGTMAEAGETEWEALTDGADASGLVDARRAWDAALADGSLVQFNPVFYALARKELPGQGRPEQE